MTRTQARLAAVSLALAVAFAHAARADVASVGDVDPPLPGGGQAVDQVVGNGMSIGLAGTGAVLVTGGASYVLEGSGTLFVANLGGASGLLLARDPGSLVDLRIPASVGHGEVFTLAEGDALDAGIDGAPSAGRVRILDGARLSSADLTLGLFAPGAGNPTAGFGDGTLEVAGTGTAAAIGGALEAGVFGEGHVLVLGGAQATATALLAGEGDLGTGTVEVRDLGSRLEVEGDLRLGDAGHGSLEVTGGGALVTPGLAHLGDGSPTGRGEALVSGAGSLWVAGGGASNFLRAGFGGGDAALTLEEGGRLELHDRLDANLASFSGAQVLLGQNGTASMVVRSGAQVLVTRDQPGFGSAQILVGGSNAVARGAASLEVKDAGTSVTITGSGTGAGGSGVQAAVLSVGANLAIGSARISDGASVLVDGRTAGGICVVARDGALGQLEVDTRATLRISGGPSGAQEGVFSVGDRGAPADLGGAIGVLRVGADALVEATSGNLGRRAATTGTAVVEATGELRLAGALANGTGATLFVGRDGGDGELDVESDGTHGGLVTIDGAAGTFPGLRIGSGTSAARGKVRVAGPGALVRVLSQTGSGQVEAGEDGQGVLEVSAGGRVLAGQGFEVGRGPGAAGEALIEGAGSEVLLDEVVATAASPFHRGGPVAIIGRAGQGTLTVRDGGRLTIRPATPVDADQITGVIAGGSSGLSGGSALIVVSGAGARLDVDSPRAQLQLGRAGAAELRVLAGGVVAIGGAGQGLALVGCVPTASGAVLVSGTASRLLVGSKIGIGRNAVTSTSEALVDGGPGAVALEDGGALAAGTAEVGPFGTLSGTGTLEGDAILLGGRLAPGTVGGAPGTLAVTGAVSVSSGAIQIEVTGAAAGQSDLLSVDGLVAFAGGEIALVPSGGHALAQGDRVRAIRARGGFTGLTSVTVTGLPPGSEARLTQSGDALEVEIVGAGQGGVRVGDDGSGHVHAGHHGGGCAVVASGEAPGAVPGTLAPWGGLVAGLFVLRRRARARAALPVSVAR